LPNYIQGLVAAAVINDDVLPVFERLCSNGFYTGRQQISPVVSGSQDAYFRGEGWITLQGFHDCGGLFCLIAGCTRREAKFLLNDAVENGRGTMGEYRYFPALCSRLVKTPGGAKKITD
jgi:hypothetical protein